MCVGASGGGAVSAPHEAAGAPASAALRRFQLGVCSRVGLLEQVAVAYGAVYVFVPHGPQAAVACGLGSGRGQVQQGGRDGQTKADGECRGPIERCR